MVLLLQILTSLFVFSFATPPPTQPFYGAFSGTTRVSRCQKRTFWTLWCKGILTEADTQTIPAGRHSIRTNQCPPPPSRHIFYGPDALPAAQPTVSKALKATFSIILWKIAYFSWNLLVRRECLKFQLLFNQHSLLDLAWLGWVLWW